MKDLSDKEVVVIGLHDMSRYASKQYGLTKSAKSFISDLREKTRWFWWCLALLMPLKILMR